jgi:hypothetical protein
LLEIGSDNKLLLHLGKTESILFGTKRRLLWAHKMKINCAGKEIESKRIVTYIGVSIDQSLSEDLIAAKILSKWRTN